MIVLKIYLDKNPLEDQNKASKPYIPMDASSLPAVTPVNPHFQKTRWPRTAVALSLLRRAHGLHKNGRPAAAAVRACNCSCTVCILKTK